MSQRVPGLRPTVAAPNPNAVDGVRDPELEAAEADLASGRFGSAVSRLEKALRRGRPSAARYRALARAHFARDDAPRALASLTAGRKSVGPDPSFDQLRFDISVSSGRFDGVDALFAKIREHGAPGETVARYVELKRHRVPPDVVALVDAGLARATMPIETRRALLSAKIGVLDAENRIDAAFDAIERLSATYPETLDPDWLAELSPAEGPIAHQPIAVDKRGDGPSAVFVVGMPRSGSTLLEMALSAHRRAVGVGESMILARRLEALVVSRNGSSTGARLGEVNQSATADELRKLRRGYFADAEKRARGAARRTIIDKTLIDHRHIAFIARAFPDAAILHTVRDPLDQLLSILRQSFNDAHAYKRSPERLARRFLGYLDVMEMWETAFPGRVIHVDHAALTADFPAGIARLLEALRLSPDPACAEPEKNAKTVQTASVTQVRRGVRRSGEAHWRRYAHRLGPVIDALGGEPAVAARYERWRARCL